MYNAWLVVNAFLNSNKFNEINEWLVKSAKKKNICLEVITNAELLPILDGSLAGRSTINQKEKNHSIWNDSFLDSIKPDFILFWDKDIRLARILEQMGYSVFNSSKAIEICDDKSYTHLILDYAGVPMPRTIIAPMTFTNIGYNNHDFLENIAKNFKFPIVVKECFGSFGQQVYLVHDKKELENCVTQIGAKPMLFQEFIETSFAKDIRLQVVGNQVITAMYRYSDNGDFRANITNGGKMKPYSPTAKEVDLALKACNAIGLDFAGVDILFGANDEPLVCEVNSNAHFKNIYDCTNIDVADAIFDDILTKL